MPPDITLQINLSAGDLAYCEQTVPALVTTHRPDVREVVVVADACRPQSTPFVHGPSRFPADVFARRIADLRQTCAAWRDRGLIDRVVEVAPDAAALRALNQKYCGRATAWSHDHLGHAFSAYFAGWHETRTRYVLHFDADILLYQAPGYSWARAAVEAMEADPAVLAVSPRIAPPQAGAARDVMVRVHEPGSGWLPTWRLEPTSLGWLSDWFSTRCHLMDLDRLERALPLTPWRGGAADAWSHAVNAALAVAYDARIWTDPAPARGLTRTVARVARKLAASVPAFPLPPEVLLYEHAQRQGLRSFYIGDDRAWFIHPDAKSEAFLTLLRGLLDRTRRGEYPEAQRGVSGIRFDAWAPA